MSCENDLAECLDGFDGALFVEESYQILVRLANDMCLLFDCCTGHNCCGEVVEDETGIVGEEGVKPSLPSAECVGRDVDECGLIDDVEFVDRVLGDQKGEKRIV